MSGGRGAYYKAKYGRGGRGNANERLASNNDNGLYLSQNRSRNDSTINRTSRDFETILRSIDGRQYGDYKQLQVILSDSINFLSHFNCFGIPGKIRIR